MLSLADISVAGSFATIRRRRLASPASISEIEATHPLVNARASDALETAGPLNSTTGRRRRFPTDGGAPPGLLSAGSRRREHAEAGGQVVGDLLAVDPGAVVGHVRAVEGGADRAP